MLKILFDVYQSRSISSMPVNMANYGLFGLGNDQDRGVDTNPSKPFVKEPSYYMDHYEATVTVHTSPPQQHHVTQLQQSSCEFLEIDDETRNIPESKFTRNKLSKKKNLRVTFSDHIEVDLIEDLYDDIDGDISEDLAVEETIYEIVKGSGGNKCSKGSFRFKEAICLQTPKPLVLSHGNSELKVAEENVSPKSPLGSPRRLKMTSPKSSKLTSLTSSPPLLHKRRISQSSMNEPEKTSKDYLQELRERRQSKNQRSITLNTLFPDFGSNTVSRSQLSYSNFLSDAKKAVERTNIANDRPWSKRSLEKPVYGLYNEKTSETTKSAGSLRKTTSLPRNFRLPETLYSGRYRRPSSDNTILTSYMGVK